MANIFLIAVIWVEADLTKASDSLLATAPFANRTEIPSAVWLLETDLRSTNLKSSLHQQKRDNRSVFAAKPEIMVLLLQPDNSAKT